MICKVVDLVAQPKPKRRHQTEFMVCEILFGVGFALLLPRFFGLDGVLYSMPAADILTALISAAVIAKTYAEMREKSAHPANSTLIRRRL